MAARVSARQRVGRSGQPCPQCTSLQRAGAPSNAAHPPQPLATRPARPPPAVQGGLVKAFEPAFAWMATRYQAVVGKELRKYGLRYEDLYDPQMDLVRCARCR